METKAWKGGVALQVQEPFDLGMVGRHDPVGPDGGGLRVQIPVAGNRHAVAHLGN